MILGTNYTYVEDTDCNGAGTENYPTLQDAKNACTNDIECTMIEDFECDGGSWKTCRNRPSTSSNRTCAWIKGTFTRFVDQM